MKERKVKGLNPTDTHQADVPITRPMEAVDRAITRMGREMVKEMAEDLGRGFKSMPKFAPPLRAHDLTTATWPPSAKIVTGLQPPVAPTQSTGQCRCVDWCKAEAPVPGPTKLEPFGPDDEEFWGQPDHAALDAPAPPFESFVAEIRQLFEKSVNKGYGPQAPDAKNPLYEFMRTFFSDDHALGEIVYKAIRYKNKRNPEDLVKIAGWAWLVFMHHWKEEAARGNR